jgi:hypothetical protein
MIGDMGKMSYSNRITVRTSAQVYEGVNVLLARRLFQDMKFRGRKLGAEGLVGAVLLDFLAKSEAEQLALIRERLPELEDQVESADEPTTEPSAKPAEPSGPARVPANPQAQDGPEPSTIELPVRRYDGMGKEIKPKPKPKSQPKRKRG